MSTLIRRCLTMMLTASIMLSARLSAVARADEPFPNDERMPGTVDTEDGNPLDQPRLVVPDDLGGARYVKDLTDLRVVNLARP